MKQKTHLITNTSTKSSPPDPPDPPEDEMVIIKSIKFTSTLQDYQRSLSDFTYNESESTTVVGVNNTMIIITPSTTDGTTFLRFEDNFGDTQRTIQLPSNSYYYDFHFTSREGAKSLTFYDNNLQQVFTWYDEEEYFQRNGYELAFYPPSKITFDFSS